MAGTGKVIALIKALGGSGASPEEIKAAVEGWLAEHVDPETGYVLDDTLSIAGAAADAKAAGDAVDELKSAINPMTTATPADIGKALVPRTVEDGKVTAWNFVNFTPVTDDKRYGVSGIGQSASALTRLYDAVGMTAQVGTDGNNAAVINDFDFATPFMRRKCVGSWTLENGRCKFTVAKYYGEVGYTEDGSIGDYVAVECPRCYYYLNGGVLVISSYQHEGFRPFDIFCHDHDPEDTMEKVYIPAYALAMKNGHAVSLPGLNNLAGCYKDLVDAARTYNNSDVAAKAILQPWAVNFYEWALYTVEFAQQNCQSVMQGCDSLRHNNNDRATLREDGKWLLGDYQAARVVGEYVSIQPDNVDQNTASYYASHKITAIIRCDANGDADAAGSYQLMTTEDLGSGRTYEVGTAYRLSARPYATGACNDVSTPSGSPVSNANGYYPMKYRWRENVFANQYKTIADLFDTRVGADSDSYSLDWYYLPAPQDYEPSSTSKPDATDLATSDFVKLDINTPHEFYKDGYIYSRINSAVYPDLWIPRKTSDASASTYYADYAYLVNSPAVRSVRVGGHWYFGASAGFSYVSGHAAPSYSAAAYGGDLFFPQ